MYKKHKYKEGQKFGNLTFLKELEPFIQKCGKPRRMCLVRCDCGNEFKIQITSLVVKKHLMCRQCTYSIVGEKNSTHKLSNHKLFSIWWDIKKRCFENNNKGYANYGARGITLFTPWINDFKAFYDYCTSLDSYNEKHLGIGGLTIDRINNDGNYEPNNIRFVNHQTQMYNRGIQNNNKSGHRCINIRPNGRWQVNVGLNKKKICVGTFDSIEEAIKARNDFYKNIKAPVNYNNI